MVEYDISSYDFIYLYQPIKDSTFLGPQLDLLYSNIFKNMKKGAVMFDPSLLEDSFCKGESVEKVHLNGKIYKFVLFRKC